MKDMRIGIDGRMIERRMHGIARHTLNMLEGILNIDRKNKYFLLVTEKFPYKDRMAFENLRFIHMKSPFVSLYEALELRHVLKKQRFDLYHSPSFIPPFYTGNPYLMTIHDLSHLTYFGIGRRLYYSLIVAPYIRSAEKILTVSEFSKSEICGFFGIKREKVVVIHNGVEKRFVPADRGEEIRGVRERYHLPEKFILAIGNEKGHKNLKGLIEALGKVERDYSLVINLKPDGETARLVKEKEAGERVHFIDYVDDKDMPYLYSAASLYALVSFKEGFGLPALESMACGCPVVVSNAASLPEICGDAAYYVDPYNSGNIAEGINRLIRDPDLRNGLIKKGLERARLFSWEKAAGEVLGLYEKACGTT